MRAGHGAALSAFPSAFSLCTCDVIIISVCLPNALLYNNKIGISMHLQQFLFSSRALKLSFISDKCVLDGRFE